MVEYVDRGDPLNGINQAVRDHRTPYSLARSLKNVSLPDGRAQRRLGYQELTNYRHVGQMLAKQTPTATIRQFHPGIPQDKSPKGFAYKTPNSYGLIRWHSALQPRTTKSWTWEFFIRLGEHEPLTLAPVTRTAKASVASAPAWDMLIRGGGCYVLDMTIMSNVHKFDSTGTIAAPGTIVDLPGVIAGIDLHFDVFPLPCICVYYATGFIQVEMGLVAKSGPNVNTYWPREIMLGYSFPGGKYTPGDTYHIAIRYTKDSPSVGKGTIDLLVDGVVRATDTIQDISTYVFLGEYDAINKVQYTNGLQRDIVLLNECTVRGSYASACKIQLVSHGHQAFFHAYDSIAASLKDPAVPLCLTPPRGTAMRDFRIWDEARSDAAILADIRKSYSSGTGTMVGNWPLNDGGGILKDVVAGRDGSVHHNVPSYITDSSLLHGIGLDISDCQHLIYETKVHDEFFVKDVHAALKNIFLAPPTPGEPPLRWKLAENHSITAQIQIKTPYTFQQELNKTNQYVINQLSSDGSESRISMKGSTTNLNTSLYALRDGGQPATNQKKVAAHDGTAADLFPLAYDQTLFSIEAESVPNDNDNYGQLFKTPLFRGLITPDGKVAMEVLLAAAPNDDPRFYRLVTTNTLNPNSYYTITFVKKVTYSSSSPTVPDGIELQIWVHDAAASSFSEWATYSRSLATDSNLRSYFANHHPTYTILVGCSQVTDGFDRSISAPFQTTSGNNSGPWRVSQHTMSPYQEQPGFFRLGYFRVWGGSLGESEIEAVNNSSITNPPTSLLFNLEIGQITGKEVVSDGYYQTIFRLGYKGWGFPQQYKNEVERYFYGVLANAVNVKRELYISPWTNQDCLGYILLDGNPHGSAGSYDVDKETIECTLIGPYRKITGDQFGIVYGFGDSIAKNASLDTFQNPAYSIAGYLGRYMVGTQKYAISLGDRTIITSDGGSPLAFDGDTAFPLGLGEWTGGIPVVDISVAGASEGLEGDYWYGIAVVYFSEKYGTYHISPRVVVRQNDQANKKYISIWYNQSHPDPRITLVGVYRTLGQVSRELAEAAPLFHSGDPNLPNRPVVETIITKTDPAPGPLDLDITSPPDAKFSAFNGKRLYLAGDYQDVVYFSGANPEQFNRARNRIGLGESTGDIITGLVSAFGSIFLFKANSTWRIDEISPELHEKVQLSSVGAVSPDSIVLVQLADTGRVVIFFWSQVGPYIFDGTSFQFVGGPVESVDGPPLLRSDVEWVEPSKVVAMYDSTNKEVLFHVQPKSSTSGMPSVLAFSLKLGIWTSYTGIEIQKSYASVLYTNKDEIGIPGNLPRFVKSPEFYTLFGNMRGQIYRWGAARDDGLPSGLTTTEFTISGTNGNQITLSGNILGESAYKYLYVTLRNVNTEEWEVLRIASNDTTTLTLENTPTISIGVGDKAYLCRPPMVIEFPWDSLDMPYLDKKLVNMAIWADGELVYKLFKDWNDTAPVLGPIKLVDPNKKRKVVYVNKALEVAKLELVSFDQDSRFDSYLWEKDQVVGVNVVQ